MATTYISNTGSTWNQDIAATLAQKQTANPNINYVSGYDVNGQLHYAKNQNALNKIIAAVPEGATAYTRAAEYGGQSYNLYQEPQIDYSQLLNSYYNQMLDAQQRQYEQEQAAKQKQIEQTVASIEANKETIDNEYQKAQQEAYINNILQQNQMNDYLQAMGYTGGLAETTANNLANNYANNRANAVSERDAALRNNERLVAEARVSGDSALVGLASDYLDNYATTLYNQAQMNYQIAQDQQNQANLDREFALKQQQYQDSLNMNTEENNYNLAAQDMQTFINTYQKKYTKKATYEKWIQNLQEMDDPYGFNAQKIAYLRQYINQNFNGGSGDSSSAGASNTVEQSTSTQDSNYNKLAVKIRNTFLYPGAERLSEDKVSSLVAEIQQMQQQRGITEAQAQALLNMMK